METTSSIGSVGACGGGSGLEAALLEDEFDFLDAIDIGSTKRDILHASGAVDRAIEVRFAEYVVREARRGGYYMKMGSDQVVSALEVKFCDSEWNGGVCRDSTVPRVPVAPSLYGVYTSRSLGRVPGRELQGSMIVKLWRIYVDAD